MTAAGDQSIKLKLGIDCEERVGRLRTVPNPCLEAVLHTFLTRVVLRQARVDQIDAQYTSTVAHPDTVEQFPRRVT